MLNILFLLEILSSRTENRPVTEESPERENAPKGMNRVNAAGMWHMHPHRRAAAWQCGFRFARCALLIDLGLTVGHH